MSQAVVIPVYNEARTVDAVLDAVRAVFDGRIIAIDDGSTDGTAELLAARRDLTVLTHPQNRGYGQSLLDGFERARSEGVTGLVTMDCDGQHEPSHLRPFLDALGEDVDLVSGSRYTPESRVIGSAPSQRREVNVRITALVNALTGYGLTDAFCGLKAYGPRALQAMTALTEPGYGFNMELWAFAHRAGLRVVERPVERIYFDHDRSFGQDLDDAERRVAYYLQIWERALAKELPHPWRARS